MDYNKVLDEIATQGNDALFSALTGNTSVVLSEVLKDADDKEKQRLAWQIPGGAQPDNKHFEDLRKFILGEAGEPEDDKEDETPENETPETPGSDTEKPEDDKENETPKTPGSDTEKPEDDKEDETEEQPSEVDVETK